MEDDGSLEAMWREHRAEGIANCQKFWDKATRLKKFAGRDQWPEGDKKKLDNPNRKSPRMTVPDTARILATFSGRQMMQRFERAYVARHQSAERYAEIMSKIDRAVMQATDAEQVDSQVFKDGPGIQGISWARYFVDEMSGPEPQLRKEKVPIWNMMWPATCDINLRDRAWHRWGSWWPQSAVKERWATQFREIQTLIGRKQWTSSEQRGESSRIPWAGQAGNKPLEQSDYYDANKRSFWIEYEEWREPVTFYSVARPKDPNMTYADALGIQVTATEEDPFERVEMRAEDWKEFKKSYETIHGEEVPKEMVVRKPRLVHRYAYGCGDKVLETDTMEVGIFTFTSMAAEVIELPGETLYIGLMEDLVDAQRMKNYMRSALIRDMQINPKGTLFVEQGLFRDKDQALTAFTSPGGVIEIPRGRLTGAASQPWRFEAGGTGPYRSMVEGMHQTYSDDIPRLAGFNPAALGQLGNDLRRISGQVVRSVQDAAMVSNAERFDALRLDRREGGRIFLAFMRLLYKRPEDLIPFIGEQDAYEDVTDPVTGEPVPDEMGQPQRRLAIPPIEMWVPEAWKEIAVEEVAPTDDDQQAFWDSLQTQIQLLTQPMPDIGEGILSSEDIVDLMPKVPAARRQKMLLRIRRLQARVKQQQMMQAQQPPTEEGGGMPAEEAAA
jgi:hypothetical protein